MVTQDVNVGMMIKNNNMRNLEREQQLYPNIFKEDLKTYKEQFYEPLIKVLLTLNKYELVWDIIELNRKYHDKTGMKQHIKLSNIEYFANKNIYDLKLIKHKWFKLAENPGIEPKDIYKNFNKE